jgi:cobalt-zinc-cadmium efflux system protein
MGEGHDHHLDVAGLRDRQRRVLWWVLAANGAFLVVEVVGGIVFSSLALLADAAHMATDVSGLAIALVAQTLLGRPSSRRHSYGLQRAEVLGAMANGILLVATAGWIMFEAVQRFGDEVEVEGGGLLVVATLGLLVNVVSAVLLARVRGRSLNLQGAFVHMLADAAGSVAAIGAGVAVVLADAYWVDAAASILIAVLVLWSSWGLLRDTVHVLLEGSPSEIDAERVLATIRATGVVDDVHHLHVWSLASDAPALSAHLVVDGSITMHEAQERGAVVRQALEDEFGVLHSTLELECHPCREDEHL